MDEDKRTVETVIEKLKNEIVSFKAASKSELEEFKTKILPELTAVIEKGKELELRNREIESTIVQLKAQNGRLVNEVEVTGKDRKEMQTMAAVIALAERYNLRCNTEKYFSPKVISLTKAALAEGAATNNPLVPTTISRQLIEDVMLATDVWRSFDPFPQIPQFFRVSKMTTKPTVYLGSENIAPPISAEATGSVLLELKKLLVYSGASYEVTEDSIITVATMLIAAQTIAMAEAIDSAVINGDADGSHFDTGSAYDPTTAPETAFDGLRKQAIANTLLNGGTSGLTYDNILTTMAALGKYAVQKKNLDNIFLLCPLGVYFDFLRLAEFKDLTKFGALATQITGSITTALGFTVIPSAQFPALVTTTGIVNSGDRKSFLIYNKAVGLAGQKAGVLVEQDKSIITQTNQVVSSMRLSFKLNFATAIKEMYYS